jgi:hypothetical protein
MAEEAGETKPGGQEVKRRHQRKLTKEIKMPSSAKLGSG